MVNSRQKGKRGELRAVKILKQIYPKARRSANQGAGAIQPDVDGTAFWVEVKEGKQPNIWRAIDQALNDRKDDRSVLVIAHKTHGQTLCVMLANEFIELLTK